MKFRQLTLKKSLWVLKGPNPSATTSSHHQTQTLLMWRGKV
jgi:hypothetical protein